MNDSNKVVFGNCFSLFHRSNVKRHTTIQHLLRYVRVSCSLSSVFLHFSSKGNIFNPSDMHFVCSEQDWFLFSSLFTWASSVSFEPVVTPIPIFFPFDCQIHSLLKFTFNKPGDIALRWWSIHLQISKEYKPISIEFTEQQYNSWHQLLKGERNRTSVFKFSFFLSFFFLEWHKTTWTFCSSSLFSILFFYLAFSFIPTPFEGGKICW